MNSSQGSRHYEWDAPSIDATNSWKIFVAKRLESALSGSGNREAGVPINAPTVGAYFDEETELHSNGARFMDPMVGAFTGPEPLLQDPDFAVESALEGQNAPAYAYALNNPVTYVDEDGLRWRAPGRPAHFRTRGGSQRQGPAQVFPWRRPAQSRGATPSPASMVPRPDWPQHYVFPQQFRDWFRDRGLNPDGTCVQIPRGRHDYIHNRHPAGRWNDRWEDFIRRNPRASPEQIQEFGGDLMREYNVLGPIAPYGLP